MTDRVAGSGATTFDRYSRRADLTMRGDEWYDAFDSKTRFSAESGSERLRDACKRFGHAFAPDLPKRRLSFEEQLALVASGRARIVDLDAA